MNSACKHRRLISFLLCCTAFLMFFPLSGTSQQEIVDSVLVKEQLELRQMIKSDPDYIRYNELIEKNARDIEAINNLGYLYIDYEDFDNAEKMFQRSISLDRAQAQPHDGLGIVYLHRGKSSIIIFETLKRAFNLDNYSRALGEFERALSLDPDMHKARYHIAETYLTIGGDGDLKKGIEAVNELIDVQNDYPGAHYMLGRLYYELDNDAAAEEELLREIALNRDHGESHYYLGLTYFRMEESEKSSENYFLGLQTLEDPIILHDIYLDLTYLFSKEENEEYISLPVKERGKFIAEYWKNKDPNVMTDENERMIEHLKRIEIVKQLYHESNFRGYDDRGMVYIKYGPPSTKHVDIANEANIHDNESWLYENINKFLAFDFAAIGGPFRLVPDLSFASTPQSIATARSLYIDRVYMGGIYGEIGGKASMGSDDFFLDLSLYNMRRDEATSTSPPQYYRYTIKAIPMSFPITMTQYRGTENSTMLDFYYGIPLGQLTYDQIAEGFSANVTTSLALLDTTYNRLHQVRRNKTINVRSQRETTSRFSVGSESISIPPGTYIFGYEIKQEDPPRLGQYQFRLPIKDFSSDDLMLSDLRVSSESPDFQVVEIRSRNQLSLTPYPFSNVRQSMPLVLYYEIYNLVLNPDNVTSYTIEYSIQREMKGGNIFSRLGRFITRKKGEQVSYLQERTGTSPTARELISIDISSIPESDAIITVTITDKNSGKQATVARRVTVIE
ncbi:GWxTD domain-containing protein [candidate division KSB1 bacterium]